MAGHRHVAEKLRHSSTLLPELHHLKQKRSGTHLMHKVSTTAVRQSIVVPNTSNCPSEKHSHVSICLSSSILRQQKYTSGQQAASWAFKRIACLTCVPSRRPANIDIAHRRSSIVPDHHQQLSRTPESVAVMPTVSRLTRFTASNVGRLTHGPKPISTAC